MKIHRLVSRLVSSFRRFKHPRRAYASKPKFQLPRFQRGSGLVPVSTLGLGMGMVFGDVSYPGDKHFPVPMREKNHACEQFEIGTFLGWGGAATVREVTDMDGKTYALKGIPMTVDADEIHCRLRELDMMTRAASGEHVIRCHDAWVEDITPELESLFAPKGSPCRPKGKWPTRYMLFIQLELADCNLNEWLQRKPRSSVERIHVFRDIAEGLKDLHSRGVMHRDVKPENIFLKLHPETGRLQAKLGDFGLATGIAGNQYTADSEGVLLDANTPHHVGLLTRDVGTLAYMAPEQRGACYDHKVDHYALGMVLWEMFEPESCPHKRFTRLKTVRDTGHVEWEPKSKRSDLAKNLVQKLVSWHPEHRPSITEILEKLTPVS